MPVCCFDETALFGSLADWDYSKSKGAVHGSGKRKFSQVSVPGSRFAFQRRLRKSAQQPAHAVKHTSSP